MAFFNKQPRYLILIFAFGLVMFLALLDLLGGEDSLTLIFYLLPVFLAAWFAGKWGGIGIAVCSVFCWGAMNFGDWRVLRSTAEWWTVLGSVIFFILVAFFLAELRSALEREKELARLDPLTRIANRRALDEYAKLELERARRYGHPLTVAYLDIDDFKKVNDHFGHREGDTLLRDLAQGMRRTLRAIDFLARLGGDEFLILLPETGAQAGLVAVRKMERQLLELTRKHGFGCTFSIGIVTFKRPPDSLDVIVQHADRMMYDAKRQGKNLIVQQEFADAAELQLLPQANFAE